METAALVAPVTAAEFVQDAFLLTGRQLFSEVFKIYIKYEYLCVCVWIFSITTLCRLIVPLLLTVLLYFMHV